MSLQHGMSIAKAPNGLPSSLHNDSAASHANSTDTTQQAPETQK